MSTLGLGLLLALGAFAILAHNMLIRRRNAVENAFAGIDAYLTMRYDLIPNLVDTVRQYAAHERATIDSLVALRSEAMASHARTDDRVRMDNRIAAGMGRLMAVAEAYPDLKASDHFLLLQRSLNEVEDRISAARRNFNAAVLDYNNGVQQFPLNLIAARMRLQPRAFFEAVDGAREAVAIGPRLGAQSGA